MSKYYDPNGVEQEDPFWIRVAFFIIPALLTIPITWIGFSLVF